MRVKKDMLLRGSCRNVKMKRSEDEKAMVPGLATLNTTNRFIFFDGKCWAILQLPHKCSLFRVHHDWDCTKFWTYAACCLQNTNVGCYGVTVELRDKMPSAE